MHSHDEENYPPPVLNSMTSLERLKIKHHYPEVDDEYVEEAYGGHHELTTTQVEMFGKIFRGTRGLTNLTSLYIDGRQRIRQRSDFV